MVNPQKHTFTEKPTVEEMIFYLRHMQSRTAFFDEMFPIYGHDVSESLACVEHYVLGEIISHLEDLERSASPASPQTPD